MFSITGLYEWFPTFKGHKGLDGVTQNTKAVVPWKQLFEGYWDVVSSYT